MGGRARAGHRVLVLSERRGGDELENCRNRHRLSSDVPSPRARIRHRPHLDDRLGPVGAVSQLAPGHRATFHADRVLSATDVWVTNTATVTGADPSGRAVRASDTAAVTIVASATRPSQPGSDGTAFTGTDAGDLGLIGLVLAIIGLAFLRAARKRA